MISAVIWTLVTLLAIALFATIIFGAVFISIFKKAWKALMK